MLRVYRYSIFILKLAEVGITLICIYSVGDIYLLSKCCVVPGVWRVVLRVSALTKLVLNLRFVKVVINTPMYLW